MEPICAISILEDLQKTIDSEAWANRECQKATFNGVTYSIDKLKKAGFVKVQSEELAINPVDKGIDAQNSSN